MLSTLAANVEQVKAEFADLDKLFLPENKSLRTLVFYADGGIQYRYYEDYIEKILETSDLDVCYITSDFFDPIRKQANPRVKVFFIRNFLSAVFARLDSKVLVIANPDLNRGSIRRAPDTVHHVYAFRGIASTHRGYRLGAFDHYDSLLCVGQYQVDEVRKTEEIYRLRSKQLPVIGYPLLDRIFREHQMAQKASGERQEERSPICLVAPTWGPFRKETSIFESCIEDLLQGLRDSPYKVWLRPHPEFVKRYPKRMNALRQRITSSPNIIMQMELSSMQCLHEADLLITDHSSISVDYFLGTERPVFFIDTPTRVDNPEWHKLGLEPVETTFRSALGYRIPTQEARRVLHHLRCCEAEFAERRRQLPVLREKLVANWQGSATVGARFIIERCT